LVGAVVSNELLVPCVVDVHGLAFAEAIGHRQANWKHIMRMEIEALRKCYHIVVVSNKMKDYVSGEMRIPSSKITVSPNGSEPQEFHSGYRRPLRVIYAGGFAYWESVDDVLEIAKKADHRDLEFYMAGDGPLRNILLERIRKESIPIKYLGRIPKQRIFTVLSTMQIGIASSTKDLTRLVASPIKVFDYLATGLPIITPKIGDWGEMVVAEDCGIALEDDSVDEYLKALAILSDETTWTRKSANAIRVIEEKHSWNKALQPIIKLLLSMENENLV
jgi:glycosyltransferase involved in cell wall biosynthesis